MAALTLLVVIVFAVSGGGGGGALHQPAQYPLSGSLPKFILLSPFILCFGAWVYIERQSKYLICPQCRHVIPTNLQWLCPYNNCGALNQRVYRSSGAVIELKRYSLIGGRCGHCGQMPAGFICTACAQPIYFETEKVRQKPGLCAHTPISERMQEIEKIAAETEPVVDVVAFVDNLGETESDIARGRERLQELFKKKQSEMPEAAFRQFKETMEDRLNKKIKEIRTGRGAKR